MTRIHDHCLQTVTLVVLMCFQVYRGACTRHQLDNLQPGTEYAVRVSAVRQSPDADIPGPFSPGTLFSTPCPTPTSQQAGTDDACSLVKGSRWSILGEPRDWSDQQWAAVIMTVFLILAVLTAIVSQWVYAYLTADEADTGADHSATTDYTSSSSSSPSSHHHHPHRTV